MPNDRRNIKVPNEDFNFLVACKPAGETWARFLVTSVRDSSRHLPVAKERNGPKGSYVSCEICGRTANNIDRLEARDCDPTGISVKE